MADLVWLFPYLLFLHVLGAIAGHVQEQQVRTQPDQIGHVTAPLPRPLAAEL